MICKNFGENFNILFLSAIASGFSGWAIFPGCHTAFDNLHSTGSTSAGFSSAIFRI
ncbi:MAG: hypothetical protein HC880_10945 [Bacteroidia bacterium]|nr:hypothetical protein [Bacteroidia bacterium]